MVWNISEFEFAKFHFNAEWNTIFFISMPSEKYAFFISMPEWFFSISMRNCTPLHHISHWRHVNCLSAYIPLLFIFQLSFWSNRTKKIKAKRTQFWLFIYNSSFLIYCNYFEFCNYLVFWIGIFNVLVPWILISLQWISHFNELQNLTIKLMQIFTFRYCFNKTWIIFKGILISDQPFVRLACRMK